MVDLQSQYQRLKPEIDEAMSKVLASCYFVGGPEVKIFAKELADYLSIEHVIPCANGTDALQIALMALGLKPGDEVITTPFTFVATAEVIALLQLKPVFVDIHPDSFIIDETQLESVIGPKTKCIIPVHLFGQVANMEAIMNIAEKNELFVVEDNAQAIGADFKFDNGDSKKAGTIGHISTTSFFPSKNLGCYGDGGALFTNNEALAAKIRMICNHGSSKRYYHDIVGVNSRLDALQAAVLSVKLKHLDKFSHARQQAATFYNRLLSDVEGIKTPFVAPYSSHVFHQYTLILEQGRDIVRKVLQDKGIPTGVYYPMPLHLQNAYKSVGYQEGDFPVSERLSKQVLSLPMHTELTQEIQSLIIKELLAAFSDAETKKAVA